MVRTLFVALLLFGSVVTAQTPVVDKRVWSLEKHLEVAGRAGALKTGRRQGEQYRFIHYDPGFTASVIITVTVDDSRITLRACTVDLHDCYDSKGKSGVEKIQKELSATEWDAIEKQLSALEFWTYKATPRFGSDGSYWVLEGVRGGNSHRVEEWSPEPNAFRETCLSLWRASGLFMGNL